MAGKMKKGGSLLKGPAFLVIPALAVLFFASMLGLIACFTLLFSVFRVSVPEWSFGAIEAISIFVALLLTTKQVRRDRAVLGYIVYAWLIALAVWFLIGIGSGPFI
jgi:hypothetical protein